MSKLKAAEAGFWEWAATEYDALTIECAKTDLPIHKRIQDEHIAFHAGHAYALANLPKCETCKHWKRWPNLQAFGECEYGCGTANQWATSWDFGCVWHSDLDEGEK